MAFQTITLPAGTAVTKHINLPTCGSWLGLVRFSLSVTSNLTNGTILLYYPDNADGKLRVRRTGGNPAQNFKNWPISANRRISRWLFQNETMMTITYTCSSDVSLIIETTRSLNPAAYPSIPTSSGEVNEITVPGDILNGKVYWL